MKKYLLLLLTMIGINGCNTYLDELWKLNTEFEKQIEENSAHIAELETLCNELNSNVLALKTLAEAMAAKDYITSITPVMRGGEQIGYTISFSQSSPVTIYDGIDKNLAHLPLVGMKEDVDGFYYWTLDGEWIIVEGKKLRCDGTDMEKPSLRIVEGVWQISYDAGKTWAELGYSDGEDGDQMFVSVELKDDLVTFTLSNGTVFSLHRSSSIEIYFSVEGSETDIEARKEIYIDYSLTNATEKTFVTAMSDGNYKVAVRQTSISEGQIIVTAPKFYEDGHVTIMVYDGEGYSFTKLITFYKREIHYPHGMEYRLSPQGGKLQIPLNLNFEYDLRIENESWISVLPDTKAEMRSEYINLTIAPNYDFTERVNTVNIIAKNNPDEAQSVLTIIQDPAYFSIEKDRFVFWQAETSFEVWINSSFDLNLENSAQNDWLNAELEKWSGDTYRLKAEVSRNTATVRRSVDLVLKHSVNGDELGRIEVIQLYEGAEHPDDMIFTVRANYANEFTVYLPLSEHIDCHVDWGDGKEEYFQTYIHVWDENREWISHVYDTAKPADYTVRVSGNVGQLSSLNIPVHTITEVNQWGNVELTSMDQAFAESSVLKKLVGDTRGAFKNVNNFNSAFRGCAQLTELPEELFRYCANVTNMDNTFSNCSALARISEALFHKCINVTSMGDTFANCTSLVSIPGDLFYACKKLENCFSLFINCTQLRAVPEKLFFYTPDLKYIDNAFYCCHNITSVPVNLFDNNRKISGLATAFVGLHNIQGESPYSIIEGKKVHLYERKDYPDYFVAPASGASCFNGSNFSDMNNMPDDWK